jgi:hypothetical protein
VYAARVPRPSLTSSQRSTLDHGLDLTPADPILDPETKDELVVEAIVNAEPGTGVVWTALWSDGGVPLTPDQARQWAAALLVGADYVEFGPGEWKREALPEGNTVTWVSHIKEER